MGLFSSEKKRLKVLEKIADEVLAKEDYYKALDNSTLIDQTNVLKKRLENGETLNDILVDAFAVVREASARVLGMRHFKVQIMGGVALHQGRIAEMKTGEGKTLVATLPAYLNALSGKGVHVVTVNEYLAQRDAQWMGKVYKFLGLTVGVAISGMEPKAKKEAYDCDITYCTNNELGFDYLRDNMVVDKKQRVQRGQNFAIVDEVDSILIDEARTPLIISGRGMKSSETYVSADKFAKTLKVEEDFEIDAKIKAIHLTEQGIEKAERYFKVDNLSDVDNLELDHHIMNALKANYIMKRDENYIVRDDEILIVDEFTGRLMQGRRYSDGLHQAIEAKEGVKIQDETQTLASITFQNLFRLYPKLAGMTGTAMTEEAEFGKIYNLEVTTIPTNKPDIRINYPDVIYKTERAKFNAVVEDIIKMHNAGRPVLVGTISIEKSEYVSALLKQRKIPHHVLNAKHHEKEAYIIAQAGRAGAVTIATNMAGRGTDILLGGNAEFLAKDMLDSKGITPESPNYEEEKNDALKQARSITEAEHAKVVEAGGLHVIGTERHESRRIDNQLRGRAARQGDPGSTRFFLSMEDNLMRIFGGEKMMALMDMLNVEENMAIENTLITRQIQSAQKKVETYHFDIRKSVLEYDDVMNIQREKFYAQRRKVLAGKDLSEDIYYMIEKEIDRLLRSYIAPDLHPEEYVYEDLQTLIKELHSIVPQLSGVQVSDIQNLRFEPIYDKLKTLAIDAYRQHEEEIIQFYNQVVSQYDPEAEPQEPFSSNNVVRNLEKDILLRVVDNKWIDHLHNIDMLREGIGLRAYGQKDPLIEYKREAYDLFNKMMYEIQGDTVKHLFRTKFGIQVIGPDNEDVA